MGGDIAHDHAFRNSVGITLLGAVTRMRRLTVHDAMHEVPGVEEALVSDPGKSCICRSQLLVCQP